jgi:hypothetical protein
VREKVREKGVKFSEVNVVVLGADIPPNIFSTHGAIFSTQFFTHLFWSAFWGCVWVSVGCFFHARVLGVFWKCF